MKASAKRAAYDGFDGLADFYARKTETKEIPEMHENTMTLSDDYMFDDVSRLFSLGTRNRKSKQFLQGQ